MAEETEKLMGQDRIGKPIISYPWTSITEPQLVEDINTDGADYKAIVEGTPYPDSVNYANHVLLFQDPVGKTRLKRTYLNLASVKFEEQISIAIKNDEIFYLTSGGIVFVEVDGIGTAWFPTRAARTRIVEATAINWLSIGETKLPLAATTLSNGGVVINSDATGTTTNIQLWNPLLVSYRGLLGFTFTEVITDSFVYGGTWNGITIPNFTVPASIPSATQYAIEITAGRYGLKEFSSTRWKQNIYSNRAVFFPLV